MRGHNQDKRLIRRIEELLRVWEDSGVPGRATLQAIVDEVLAWREAEAVPGIWVRPPVLLGATLDDGWGHGIQLILKYATAIGCQTEFIGLLQDWETIADACQKHRPDILGVTVLQFDTEDALVALCRHLPERTTVVAGGPVFQIDKELASRVGIHYVARDVSVFLKYMIAQDFNEK